MSLIYKTLISQSDLGTVVARVTVKWPYSVEWTDFVGHRIGRTWSVVQAREIGHYLNAIMRACIHWWMDKPILNKPILNYTLHAYKYTFKITMYVNGTFSPSISGHNVHHLLPFPPKPWVVLPFIDYHWDMMSLYYMCWTVLHAWGRWPWYIFHT